MRNLFRATVPILILLLSFVYVSAHSGRTDSNGGHYNRSTGEYHYHHGKSAHQHEDRDGDGYPEYCPYESEKSDDHSDRINNYDEAHDIHQVEDKKPEEKKKDGTALKIIIFIIVLAFWFLPGLISKRK